MKFNKVFFSPIIVFFCMKSFAAPDSDCQVMKNKEIEMEVISSNIENVNTTKTAEGGPYKEKRLICKNKMCAIIVYGRTLLKYLPKHPDANQSGFVQFPDINIEKEIQAMIEARSAYEQAIRNCKSASNNI